MIEVVRKIRKTRTTINGKEYTNYTITLPPTFVVALGLPDKVRLQLDVDNRIIIIRRYDEK